MNFCEISRNCQNQHFLGQSKIFGKIYVFKTLSHCSVLAVVSCLSCPLFPILDDRQAGLVVLTLVPSSLVVDVQS